ncbi:hypothetical protein OVA11_19000 [Caulobacter sp. SL161]|uniref:hypothetical protein n=1 Tax=Caulobacter sp. SL161 TaxID=2995156 RepID=UPI002276621A|nr:hypothetical protein [Caulobacter sp. SL161]MCY1649066.1 hypothetical protein [Caulobacter sp. SL161]
MSDNATSADDAARLTKITGLSVLASSLSNTAETLLAEVMTAGPLLSPVVLSALNSTVTAVHSAAEMIQGQLALIPPAPIAPAGDEAGEGEV